eukprot:TRINITY_DN1708_c0_g2_i1.p1 TRINITY_DN1708_c0_g2~~TRINITY_DN1708_c0_g2_i1.p1  ORF type:complete len:462 (+),score=82.58 TRINITY_DN1708_c0_g2_i1:169-1386(+)
MLKKSGKTNGYFVFRKPNSVRAALRKDMHEFEGKKLRVEVPRGLTADTKIEAEPRKRKVNFKDRKEIMKTLPQRQVYLSHLSKPVNQDIIKSLIDERLPHLSESFEGVKMMGEKNCCFVTFKKHSEVQEFCAVFDGFPLLGQNLVAVPAAAPGVMKGKASPEEEDDTAKDDEPEKPTQPAPRSIGTCLQILVGILPDDVKVTDVRAAFSSCGNVSDVKLIRNRNTGVFTGVASVRFERHDSVKKALSMNGETITLGRPVEVSIELDDNSDPVAPAAKPTAVAKRRNTVSLVQELKPIVKAPASEPAVSKTKRKRTQRESIKKQKLAPLPTRPDDDDSDAEIVSDNECDNTARKSSVGTSKNDNDDDDDDDDDDFQVVPKQPVAAEKPKQRKPVKKAPTRRCKVTV